jgi:hypothetical protein
MGKQIQQAMELMTPHGNRFLGGDIQTNVGKTIINNSPNHK